MNNKNKTFSLLLAIIAVVCMVASCKEKSAPVDNQNTTDTSGSSGSNEPDSAGLKKDTTNHDVTVVVTLAVRNDKGVPVAGVNVSSNCFTEITETDGEGLARFTFGTCPATNPSRDVLIVKRRTVEVARIPMDRGCSEYSIVLR